MSKAEKSEKKLRPHQFQPGRSGNPAGKPPGTLNRTTRAAQTLLDGEAEGLTRKAIELALEGNIQALKLCIERLVPPRKERIVDMKLPEFSGVDSLPGLTAALLQAVSSGDLTVGEAAGLSSLVANHGKALELAELEKRIVALEGKNGGKNCEQS